MRLSLIAVSGALFFSLATLFAPPAEAQQASCNAPASDAIVNLDMPGGPFEPVVTPDGCWIFVTIAGGNGGGGGRVVVVRRDAGSLRVERIAELKGNPTGAVLTHDGRTLVVADGGYIAFLDAQKLISGNGNPVLGYMGNGGGAGFINVNVTHDDRLLFAAAERAEAIEVINLDTARATQFADRAVIGRIPTGNAPIALSFSPDEKYLYTTSEGPRVEWSWPRECKPDEQPSRTPPPPPSRDNNGRRNGGLPRRGAILTPPPSAPFHARGAVMVVDMAAAATNPESSVRSIVAAGCEPVRLVLSPDGATAYVSARSDDQLLAFDTQRLLTDTAHALIGHVDVGVAPVGVAVVDSGARVFVTNSNRFEGGEDDRQPVAIVDAAKLRAGGSKAKIGTIPAGGFPRELRVSPDGRTLFVTNFASRTLEMVDLARAH